MTASSLWPLVVALFLPLLAASGQDLPLFISEFLAANSDLSPDEDTENPDWIEIHNPTETAVELDGYFLTDNLAQPMKWAFPVMSIAPREYLVVFASGKNQREARQPLHTNFSLNDKGEYLALNHASSELPVSAFAPAFPGQVKNVSYGVDAKDPARLGYMVQPSPGSANAQTFFGFVKDTKFSVDRGFYLEPFELVLSTATEGAEIRFTTDGTEPSASHGEVYAAPLTIAQTTILRVMALREDYVSTNIDTHTYLFARDVKSQPDMDERVTEHPDYVLEIDEALGSVLPAMSVVVDAEAFFGPTGIHSQPERGGLFAELPISLEYFDPNDLTDRFQIHAGIRLHGGNARTHPKKPFRLYFREDYGASRLRHSLFDGLPVAGFEQLVLRSCGHDSWSLAKSFGTADADIPPHASFLRDEFLRRTERAMGLLSPAGKFVHLYINGAYWGVYNLHERPNASFFSDHLGGDAADWDVLHHPEFEDEQHTVVNGTDEAWNALQSLTKSQVADEAALARFEEYLDLDAYMDALIVRMWSGDYDWCGPVYRPIQVGGGVVNRDVTIFGNKNWYTGRQSRNNGSGKFHFHTWDAEMSMGLHLMFNLEQRDVDQRVIDLDLSAVDDPGSPAAPYAALIGYPPFKRRFADRIHKHLSTGGALNPDVSQVRLQELIDTLDKAIIAESARWGNTSGRLLTRDLHWRPEVMWLRDTFLVERSDAMVAAFQDRNIYPRTQVASLNQYGGVLGPNEKIDFTTSDPNARIYYTTDGTDPANLPRFDTLEVLREGALVDWIVPSDFNGGHGRFVWTRQATYPQPQLWHKGETGLGFEIGDSNFKGEYATDVAQVMHGKNASLYARVNFIIPSLEALDNMNSLLLMMKYDDGFVAYVNGILVADANAPQFLDSRSEAAQSRTDQTALVEEVFNITSARDSLQVGRNVLAVHGLNSSATSSDFLMTPRIELRTLIDSGGPSKSARRFSDGLALSESANVKARVLDAFGNWSVLTEAYFSVQPPLQPSDLAITEINYRPAPPETLAELAAATERSAFEFLEIANLRDHTIDLTGVQFTKGIRFTFPQTLLGVGERVVLVRDLEAFQARYGDDARVRVAGAFAQDTQLSDTGEVLTLVSASDEILISFRYDDRAPWPATADGDGASLIYHPQEDRNPEDPANWSASLDPNGYPGDDGFRRYEDWQQRYGLADGAAQPESDPDGDTLPNLLEYAFGSHPLLPSEQTNFLAFAITPEAARFQFLRRPQTADVTYELELSTDLASWDQMDFEDIQVLLESNIKDREQVTVTLPSESNYRYARLRATWAPAPLD